MIRGYNFDQWPADIVLGYNRDTVRNGNTLYQLMKLEDKTPNTLTFRVQETHTFGVAHTWELFGSPNDPPRAILEYRLL